MGGYVNLTETPSPHPALALMATVKTKFADFQDSDEQFPAKSVYTFTQFSTPLPFQSCGFLTRGESWLRWFNSPPSNPTEATKLLAIATGAQRQIVT